MGCWLYELLAVEAKRLAVKYRGFCPTGSILDAASERVIGELQVVAPLPLGFERLTLFFTDRRMIVSHGGKVGAGSIPATFMFGSVGGALSSIFGRKRGPRKPKSQYPSPSRILSSDKDNFSIFFDEVVTVELKQTLTTNTIAIHTRTDKFDFTCRSRFDLVLANFEKNLGPKLVITRKG